MNLKCALCPESGHSALRLESSLGAKSVHRTFGRMVETWRRAVFYRVTACPSMRRGLGMRLWRTLRWLSVTLAVSACAENAKNLQTHYLDQFATPNPTLTDFTVCHGFYCSERSPATISEDQWRRVTAVFKPRAKNARHERQQIARGVALIQTIVGPQTGTNAHQWTHRNMFVIPNAGDLTQLDCVDTSINTWTYMTLMERSGLFAFHRVAPLSYAPQPIWALRNTAVLQEIDGGYFAIDASLVDHGVPPLIMPLATWLGSWPPDPAAIERVDRTDTAEGQLRP
jgi:hypothetical protein